MTLPTADWLAALADMDAAVASALSGLDAFEARWPDAPAVVASVTDFEARLSGWDERLVAAGRLAEGLEREFAEGAVAVATWGEAFTALRSRIQQPTDPPA